MDELKMNTPQLNEGEIYAGAIIAPDGSGNHIILLPGDANGASWSDQMEWAKSIGGELPSRPVQALLYELMPEEFKEAAYWSNTQHSGYSNYAWYQNFDNGFQGDFNRDRKLRARAVRRIYF